MIRMLISGRQAAAVAALGLAALMAGCGGGGGSASGSGQLSVLMGDAPLSLTGVSAVNVTISKVEVHGGSSVDATGTGTDSSWKTVWQGSQTFNLLALANVKDMTTLPHIVDRGSLPAGHYNQLRMIVSSGNIVVNGTPQPLVIPSGGNTGLKALPFDVASRQDTVLFLDFDLSQSVNLQGDGTYKLQPVIRLAPVTLTASVTGKIVNASGAPLAAQVDVKDASGTVVATSLTTVAATTSPNDGVFAVHGLPSGSYTLEVSATGYTTATQPVTLTAPDTMDAGSVSLTAGP
jgi:hypothetical protein